MLILKVLIFALIFGGIGGWLWDMYGPNNK